MSKSYWLEVQTPVMMPKNRPEVCCNAEVVHSGEGRIQHRIVRSTTAPHLGDTMSSQNPPRTHIKQKETEAEVQ